VSSLGKSDATWMPKSTTERANRTDGYWKLASVDETTAVDALTDCQPAMTALAVAVHADTITSVKISSVAAGSTTLTCTFTTLIRHHSPVVRGDSRLERQQTASAANRLLGRVEQYARHAARSDGISRSVGR